MKIVLTAILLAAVAARAQDGVTTLAGLALVSGATNGMGTNALFNDPAAIAVDAAGNVFVADSQNDAIREITTNGVVTTFAGQMGVQGSADGRGTNAQFDAPSGLAFDANGNLLVSDTGNNTIREITPAGAVSTIAGIAGDVSNVFSAPLGIAVAANGAIFVADSGNQCIREIFNGAISTFAGEPQIWGTADGLGANAQFDGPVGLAFDAHGNLFVSDANNDTIREITPAGDVSTFAGLPGADGAMDGSLQSARFRSPAELTFDRNGNLFVADSMNQIIREIGTNGLVQTISGLPGVFGATNGVNGQGRFFNPYGLAFEPDGSLIVSDTYNEMIRLVTVPFMIAVQQSEGNKLVLSWDSVIGRNYQVQYMTSADCAIWSNLDAPVTAACPILVQTDSIASSSGKIYRVIILQ